MTTSDARAERSRPPSPAPGASVDLDPVTVPVLVTGAGGPAAVSVIQALRSAGFPVLAVDADPRAVGLRLADVATVLPRYHEPSYVTELAKFGEAHGARLLIPTLAEEMATLDREAGALREAGIAAWYPTSAAVGACLDKWLFAVALQAAGLPAPATAFGTSTGVPGPWVVKPRFGRGSRDVYFADSPDDLAWAVRHVSAPIVQTRLTGREFTVDALQGRDGEVLAAVPRWRLETRGGISTHGETFADPELHELVARLLTELSLRGPANVQGFRGDDGSLAITEVNPRFSGGLPLSLAAGADLVGQYVRLILGLPVQRDRLAWRAGVSMYRYFAEVFES